MEILQKGKFEQSHARSIGEDEYSVDKEQSAVKKRQSKANPNRAKTERFGVENGANVERIWVKGNKNWGSDYEISF